MSDTIDRTQELPTYLGDQLRATASKIDEYSEKLALTRQKMHSLRKELEATQTALNCATQSTQLYKEKFERTLAQLHEVACELEARRAEDKSNLKDKFKKFLYLNR